MSLLLDTHASAYTPERISSCRRHKPDPADTDRRPCSQYRYACSFRTSSFPRRKDCSRRRHYTPEHTYCRLRNIAREHKHHSSANMQHMCSSSCRISVSSSNWRNRYRPYIPQHTYCSAHNNFQRHKRHPSPNKLRKRLSGYCILDRSVSSYNPRSSYNPVNHRPRHRFHPSKNSRLAPRYPQYLPCLSSRNRHIPGNYKPKTRAPKWMPPKRMRNNFAAPCRHDTQIAAVSSAFFARMCGLPGDIACAMSRFVQAQIPQFDCVGTGSAINKRQRSISLQRLWHSRPDFELQFGTLLKVDRISKHMKPTCIRLPHETIDSSSPPLCKR